MARHGHLVARVLAAALLLTVIAACTPSPSGDTFTLTVTVEGTGTGTVTSVPVGIDVTSGDVPDTLVVADGTAVTLTAVAAAGSTFEGWSGACAGTDPCDFDMDADANVTATFTLDSAVTDRTLTVTVEGTGTGTVTSVPVGIDVTTGDAPDAADFAEDTMVTLTAAPAADSTFTGWSGDCTGTDPSCVLTMDNDANVTATFTLDPVVGPTRTLTVNVVGNGTVESFPVGINATNANTPDSHDFADGETVTLTAYDAVGYTFTGWSGNCTDTNPSCVLTMDGDANVTATFTPDAAPTRTLTVTLVEGAATGVAVTSNPTGIDTDAGDYEADFDVNESVTLTAVTTTGAFYGWAGGVCDGVRVPECVVTLDADTDVTAMFNDIQTQTVRTGASNDDGVEFLGDSAAGAGTIWREGWVWVDRGTLDLGWAPFHNLTEAAFRFPGVTVPAGATVVSAVLQVTAAPAETGGGGFPTTGTMSLTIEGEKSLVAGALVQPPDADTNFNITLRDRTAESVVWDITTAWAAGDVEQAPDAVAILQEIVDQAGWTSGSPVMLMLKGGSVGNYRRVYPFDSGAPDTRHPTLLIEYVEEPALP